MSESTVAVFELSGSRVAVVPQAEELKSAALERAALVGLVTDEPTNKEATEALKGLKVVINLCESTRKKVKEPVLELARTIDQTAKEFTAELQEEFNRISRGCADYQTAQLERVKEQERARRAEEERIQREKDAELRKIEEERKAKEEEAKAKALAEQQAAKNDEERLAAEQRLKDEQKRLQEEADKRAKDEEARRQIDLQTVAPVAPPDRAVGQMAKPVWMFEVTDIWTLARLHPALVEITPRKQQINEVIASLAAAGEPKLAGLRIWQEVKVGVRTGRERVLDV